MSATLALFIIAERGFDIISGFTIGDNRPPVTAVNFDFEIKQIQERGSTTIFVADTIEALAGRTGINPDGLRNTINEYNRACATGRDDIFSKKAIYLRPIIQPPFYAGRTSPLLLNSEGGWEGIKVNYKTEALSEEFEVIPGLYAAGTDAACNIYHDTYPNILPGNNMGFAINSGRMAGGNAVEYIKTAGR